MVGAARFELATFCLGSTSELRTLRNPKIDRFITTSRTLTLLGVNWLKSAQSPARHQTSCLTNPRLLGSPGELAYCASSKESREAINSGDSMRKPQPVHQETILIISCTATRSPPHDGQYCWSIKGSDLRSTTLYLITNIV